MDFAGKVEAVGEGVTTFNIGDEVYGCAGGLADLQDTLAEYKPRALNMREAVALPLVGTAYEGLTRTNVGLGAWRCRPHSRSVSQAHGSRCVCHYWP